MFPAGLRAVLLRWDVIARELPSSWDVDRLKSSSAAAAGLSGWFYTSLFSGPVRGFAGAALWTGIGWAAQSAVDAASEWRGHKADDVRLALERRAALSPADAAAVDALLQRARSERLHAMRGAGAAAKIASGAVPAVPSLDEAISIVLDRSRSGDATRTSHDAQDMETRLTTPVAATAATRGEALDVVQAFNSSWLPVHRLHFNSGEDRMSSSPGAAPALPLQRLTARLRDLDERLGITTTEEDIARARGLTVTAGDDAPSAAAVATPPTVGVESASTQQ